MKCCGVCLTRRGISETERESVLTRVESRGSVYIPQVNAFCIREFQMVHVAEDVARFLHQACQGLPHSLNGHAPNGTEAKERNSPDHFYARVIEHAVAYFGSRVLYPSRPAPETGDLPQLSRAGCEKAAQIAAQADMEEFESRAQQWGDLIGHQIYEAYLAGKVAPAGVRRLFLAHLDEPGLARKVCATVIAKLRSIVRN